MYLLDQGILLALLKGNSYALKTVEKNLENCYIPAIVAAELYRMDYPESKQESIKNLIDSFLVVEFDKAASIKYGEIQQELKRNDVAVSIVDVIIAATALSLGATIITHRVKQFNIIPQFLHIENWTKPYSILSLTEKKPGVLYQAAKLMQELGINIIEVISCADLGEHSSTNSFHLIIDIPYTNIPEELQSRLNNVEYQPYVNQNPLDGQQKTKIQFKCSANSQFNGNTNNVNKHFVLVGKDRVGLLADVTKLIFEDNVNIIASGGHLESISQDKKFKFHLRLDLSGDLNESEWEALLKKIRLLEGIIEARVSY